MKKILPLAAVAVSVLFWLILASVTIIGLLNPQRASVGFGLAIADDPGALYYRVYATRNATLILTAFTFIALRYWRPLAILTTLTTPLAITDRLLLGNLGISAPPFHLLALILLVLSSALLWQKVLTTDQSS
ncbi:hypothetical protein EHO60_01595 [Leptospira fletcheri]|uniref:DUF4267 domain-containing protein n=1 Tax=Leptospira fletcheri TaxID=2484981 RepID=A0A4R9GJZ6_9LEPT|nr:hypothetical protein [Leptospira fletcheri]TGK14064.1 hypothetical protein EHO60_01595 [Leptospira fletcheri]